MNSGKRSNSAASVAQRDPIGEWSQLLNRCERKPTRKRVHALRVATLRLTAELEIDLAELPRASHQAQAILQFSKNGEKLRKALGPVRELDVWIGKVQWLQASLAKPGDYTPRSTRDCIQQLERFESRLRQKRRRLEKKLIAAIEKRKDSFHAARELDVVLDADANRGASAADMINARFAEVVKAFPGFDEENLHEFRKHIKMIRYLAEIHQDGDPACAQIAAQMKKLQGSIGEWHDWQALAREIRRGRSKDKDAVELLQSIAAESLDDALTACRSFIHKLIANDVLVSEARLAPKVPQHADLEFSETADRKLA